MTHNTRLDKLEQAAKPTKRPDWKVPIIEVLADQINSEEHINQMDLIKEDALKAGWQNNRGIYAVEVIKSQD